MLKLVKLLLLSLSFASCFYQKQSTSDAWNLNKEQEDSISFYSTHHYTQNFNFSVRSDSLGLIVQQPVELLSGFAVDTIYLYSEDRVVVADIIEMPSDTVDTVWVKVARDQQTIGWIHEKDLLSGSTPDTPISYFIDYFSDTHLIIGIVLLAVISVIFVFRRYMRLGSKIVFLNDIPSVYPRLLCFFVATAAVQYSSIQLFAPESWRHYYYHPTLNPFVVPFHLSIFLFFVWLLIIVGIATIDDSRKYLKSGEALIYYLGLLGTCFIFYVIFSVLTLYYVGYILYILLLVSFVSSFLFHNQDHYRCGKCGCTMSHKGKCPNCGSINI